jgi:hypothetical protein
MARLKKNEEDWHRITIKTRHGAEMILMGHGRDAQLSIWCDKRPDHGRGGFAYFMGEKALKTLARAILKPNPRSRRKGKGDQR